MNRIALILASGLVLGANGVVEVAASGEEPNATAAFLGPESQWPRCGIALQDIQGLWGGTAIYLEGSGACLIRIVHGQNEKRFTLKLSPEETTALRKACIEADLLTVQIKDRPGMPDEARPKIILRNSEEKTHELAKWATDKVPRFGKVYEALLALRKKTEGVKPVYEGKYQRDWKPVQAPGTKTSLKGWELYVWQEKGDTYFSLLEGTNRLKTDEEIAQAAVKGIDAIKPMLAELKPGEEVFVVGKKLLEPSPKEPASVVREYGKKIGLKVRGQSQ